MKAALITEAGSSPIYTDFRDPVAAGEFVVVKIAASSLSHVTRARASGSHYSSKGGYPFVPGIDGTGVLEDGQRVYFMMPEAPFGGMAEFCLVERNRCIPLPDGLDDVAAAAMAIPGMSSWAAFAERARLVAGETVLINGATGLSGMLAVQIARHLGAAKVIATGRDAAVLEALKSMGADVTISLHGDDKQLDEEFQQQFAGRVDVVLDYLWGRSAELLLVAAAKAAPDGVPLRYIDIGSIGGLNITLPSAVIRSTAIQLMGSGIGSVPMPRLAKAIGNVLGSAVPAGFKLASKMVPLSQIEATWNQDEGRDRIVFVPQA